MTIGRGRFPRRRHLPNQRRCRQRLPGVDQCIFRGFSFEAIFRRGRTYPDDRMTWAVRHAEDRRLGFFPGLPGIGVKTQACAGSTASSEFQKSDGFHMLEVNASEISPGRKRNAEQTADCRETNPFKSIMLLFARRKACRFPNGEPRNAGSSIISSSAQFVKCYLPWLESRFDTKKDWGNPPAL